MIKFYICRHCGNVVVKLVNSGVGVHCCGEAMQELFANTVEASVEKHIPVIEKKDSIVNVRIGSVDHPMTDEHRISWVVLVTEDGYQVKNLKVGDLPVATFDCSDEVKEVYAYCNLHGLWKAN